MIVSNLEMENAEIILNKNYGYIAKAIESIKKEI
jgi:hypothetical protein